MWRQRKLVKKKITQRTQDGSWCNVGISERKKGVRCLAVYGLFWWLKFSKTVNDGSLKADGQRKCLVETYIIHN